jgi:hypothetical protein
VNEFKTVVCYQTYDGKLFTDDRKAKEHSDDLLGEELDGLFKLANMDIERSRQMKALLTLMKDRKALKQSIDKLHGILNFQFNDEAE